MNSAPQIRAKIIVEKNAPTKPSTVFLGDSLMSGVRPMVIPGQKVKDKRDEAKTWQDLPQMYAKMSLHITNDAGNQNHIKPSSMLLTTK